jgi:hypothetical protein
MVEGDYASLVKTRPVGQWKETLAVLATYTGARPAGARVWPRAQLHQPAIRQGLSVRSCSPAASKGLRPSQ